MLFRSISDSPLIALLRSEEKEKQELENKIRESWHTADWQQYDAKHLRKIIEQQRRAMLTAAKDLDFDSAARLRDELLQMEDKLQAME